jgi:hypothetical protein
MRAIFDTKNAWQAQEQYLYYAAGKIVLMLEGLRDKFGS